MNEEHDITLCRAANGYICTAYGNAYVGKYADEALTAALASVYDRAQELADKSSSAKIHITIEQQLKQS